MRCTKKQVHRIYRIYVLVLHLIFPAAAVPPGRAAPPAESE